MSPVYLCNCLWLMFFPIKWFANMHTGVNLNQCNVVLEKPSAELGLSPLLSLVLSLDQYPNPILGLNQLLIPSEVLIVPPHLSSFPTPTVSTLISDNVWSIWQSLLLFVISCINNFSLLKWNSAKTSGNREASVLMRHVINEWNCT